MTQHGSWFYGEKHEGKQRVREEEIIGAAATLAFWICPPSLGRRLIARDVAVLARREAPLTMAIRLGRRPTHTSQREVYVAPRTTAWYDVFWIPNVPNQGAGGVCESVGAPVWAPNSICCCTSSTNEPTTAGGPAVFVADAAAPRSPEQREQIETQQIFPAHLWLVGVWAC